MISLTRNSSQPQNNPDLSQLLCCDIEYVTHSNYFPISAAIISVCRLKSHWGRINIPGGVRNKA